MAKRGATSLQTPCRHKKHKQDANARMATSLAGILAKMAGVDMTLDLAGEMFDAEGREFLVVSSKVSQVVLEDSVCSLKSTLLNRHPEATEEIERGCQSLSLDLKENFDLAIRRWAEWYKRFVLSIPRCIPVLGVEVKAGEIGSLQEAGESQAEIDDYIVSKAAEVKALRDRLQEIDRLTAECKDTMKMLDSLKAKQAVYVEANDIEQKVHLHLGVEK